LLTNQFNSHCHGHKLLQCDWRIPYRGIFVFSVLPQMMAIASLTEGHTEHGASGAGKDAEVISSADAKRNIRAVMVYPDSVDETYAKCRSDCQMDACFADSRIGCLLLKLP
jgi:hypothetical protein